jgi:hypothetical protein
MASYNFFFKGNIFLNWAARVDFIAGSAKTDPPQGPLNCEKRDIQQGRCSYSLVKGGLGWTWKNETVGSGCKEEG